MTPGRTAPERISLLETPQGWMVCAADKPILTPAGRPLAMPTRALAEACADEWRALDGRPQPANLPLTRMANVALDLTPNRRPELTAMIAGYAGSDLIAFRAEGPAELVALQTQTWGPLVAWGRETLSLALIEVFGTLVAGEDPGGVFALERQSAAFDNFRLTALAHVVGVSGSAVIGFAVLHGELSGAQAASACMLDELYSLRRWGEDAELRARVERTGRELEEAARFLAALSA